MSNKLFSFEQVKEFDNHHLIVFFYNQSIQLKGFITIHRSDTTLPSFGATRIWHYENSIEALRDTLKLSRLMSYKSALAGLPYGGAKAALMLPENRNVNKKKCIEEYIKKVDYLGGKFITGADVGVDMTDLAVMKKLAPKYIVGTKNDAVKYTAFGVYYSIKTCLQELYGIDTIHNRTFAIQGVGKTGRALVALLYNQAKMIYISDINTKVVKQIKEDFPKVIPIAPEEIYKQKVDVFSPCALSNSINVRTLPLLQCKIVAGSANSQLSNKHMGILLHKLSILYAPDFVINAGGLITVTDEYEHQRNDENRIHKKVKNIQSTLETIIAESKRRNESTNIIAVEKAEEIMSQRKF